MMSRQLLEALRALGHADQKDGRSRFWSVYKSEAEEFDAEFLKKSNGDLDIVLIFAGLFSAVSTTFIQGMIPDLSPDPADNMQAMMRMVVHALNGTIFPEQTSELPSWDGPDNTIVWTQSILYASLSASLLAAFGAVMGKQWVSHYARVGVRGSIEDRCKDRQQKLHGVKRWHLRTILDFLPLLLQASLLLFGIGIASHIWKRHHVVAGIIIAAVALGVFLYTVIVFASLMSPDCPFKTPIADACFAAYTFMHRAWRRALHNFKIWLDYVRWKNDVEYRLSDIRNPISQVWARFTLTLGYLIVRVREDIHHWDFWPFILQRKSESGTHEASSPKTFVDLDLAIPTSARSDAMAVAWILETSTDLTIITDAARIVPEIDWPIELDAFDAFSQLCWAFSTIVQQNRFLELLPPSEQARLVIIGKAVLHLYFEKVVVAEDFSSKMHTWNAPIMRHLPSIFSKTPPGTVLYFILHLFHLNKRAMTDKYSSRLVSWPDPTISPVPESLVPWVSHSIPFMLCNPSTPFDAEIGLAGVIASSLASPQLLSKSVITDLLLGAGLLMGMSIDARKLTRVDKSRAVHHTLRQVLRLFRQALPLDSAAAGWDQVAAFAICLLEPVCNLVQEYGLEFHMESFPVWSLHLSKHILSSRPRLSLHLSKLVQPLPLQAYLDKNQNLLHEKLGCLALRLSVLSAGQPGVPLQSDQRMWRLNYGNNSLPVDTNIGWDWLLAFGVELKLRSMDDTTAQNAYAPTITHVVLVLCEAVRVSECASNPQLLDLMLWSMKQEQHSSLRYASLKLAYRIREILTTLLRPSVADFFVTLQSVSELAPYTQDCGDDVLDRDVAFIGVVASLAKSNKFDEYLSTWHIQRCLGIVESWFNAGIHSLIGDELPGSFDGEALWKPAFLIFVQCGWMPDDQKFKKTLFDQVWAMYHWTLSDYLGTGRSWPPLILTNHLPDDMYQLKGRINVWIEWLEYCQAELSSRTAVSRATEEIGRLIELTRSRIDVDAGFEDKNVIGCPTR